MRNQSIFVFVLFCLFCVDLYAVDCHTEPQWWTKRYLEGTFPSSLEKTVLVIGTASGYDSNDTERKARADALVKVSDYLGASHVVENVVENNVVENDVKSEHSFDSFMEHIETDCVISQNKTNELPYTVYYLLRLTRHPRYLGQEEKVKLNTNYPFSALVFVPGAEQFYKKQYLRGSLFLGGEVLLIGGIAASFGVSANYKDRHNNETNTERRSKYGDWANAAYYTGWAFVGAAAALYIWNILDGVFAPGEPALFADGKKIAFAPVANPSSVGLAMNLKF